MGQSVSLISSAFNLCTLCPHMHLVYLGNAQTASPLIEGLPTSSISTNSQFEGKDNQWCQVEDVQYNSPELEKEMTCWCSATTPATNCNGSYVEVDLGSIYTITSSGTYGCQWPAGNDDEWITSYKIRYSTTNIANSWQYYGGGIGTILDGNIGATEDNQFEETRNFTTPFQARYVRLYPQSGDGSGKACSTDWELYGYPPTAAPTTSPSSPSSLSNPPTATPTTATPTTATPTTAIPTTTKAPTSTTNPTEFPSQSPSKVPSLNPTKSPTSVPSKGPTGTASKQPTASESPTEMPSGSPSGSPTKSPTESPTEKDENDQGDQDQDGQGQGSNSASDPNDVAVTVSFTRLEIIMMACASCIVCALCGVAVVIMRRVKTQDDTAKARRNDDDDFDDANTDRVRSVSSMSAETNGDIEIHHPVNVSGQGSNYSFAGVPNPRMHSVNMSVPGGNVNMAMIRVPSASPASQPPPNARFSKSSHYPDLPPMQARQNRVESQVTVNTAEYRQEGKNDQPMADEFMQESSDDTTLDDAFENNEQTTR